MTKNPAALSALAKGDIKNFFVASVPGGIEAQEKAGQMALVNSTNMPKEMHPSREAFEKVGFRFGDEVDELFLKADLPKGWIRVATSHSMHSNILDSMGRTRVGIFYKGAFYDRRAYAVLKTRYGVEWIFGGSGEGYDSSLDKNQVAYGVMDADTEIFRTLAVNRYDFKSDDINRLAAEAWLRERYPDHADPTAYWDTP